MSKPSSPASLQASSRVDPAKLEQAKVLLVEVLSGKQTARKNPALTDGDTLLFAVLLVERSEPAWLEAQLRDARYSVDHRTTVGLELRGALRKPVLTALGVPPFVIG